MLTIRRTSDTDPSEQISLKPPCHVSCHGRFDVSSLSTRVNPIFAHEIWQGSLQRGHSRRCNIHPSYRTSSRNGNFDPHSRRPFQLFGRSSCQERARLVTSSPQHEVIDNVAAYRSTPCTWNFQYRNLLVVQERMHCRRQWDTTARYKSSIRNPAFSKSRPLDPLSSTNWWKPSHAPPRLRLLPSFPA